MSAAATGAAGPALRVHLPEPAAPKQPAPAAGNATVRPGLAPSLQGCSFGGAGFLRTLTGLGLIVAGGAATDRLLVEQTVRTFVEHGGQYVLVGQEHFSPDNANLDLRATAGALDSGRQTVVVLERNEPPSSPSGLDDMLRDRSRRPEAGAVWMYAGGGDDPAARRKLPSVLGHPNLTIERADWFAAQRHDIPRMLASKDINVMSVGVNHVWAKVVGADKGSIEMEWAPGSPLLLDPRDRSLSGLDDAVLHEIMLLRDKFAAGGVLTLMSDKIMDGYQNAEGTMKQVLINNYGVLGSFVMDIPFKKGTKALAIVDKRMLGPMRELAGKQPLIEIHCAGPGCDAAPAKPAPDYSGVPADVATMLREADALRRKYSTKKEL